MKILLVLALVAMMAGTVGAYADGYPNTLAIFWDTEFSETDLSITAGGFHNMYIVLLNPTYPAIALVEGGLRFTGFIINSVVWAGGGTNPIAHDNFACVWPLATVGPFPVNPDATILATYNIYAFGAPGCVELGPFSPTSVPDAPVPVPAYADPTNSYYINLTLPVSYDFVGEDGFGAVASINQGCDGGVVATDDNTLSAVKELFR